MSRQTSSRTGPNGAEKTESKLKVKLGNANIRGDLEEEEPEKGRRARKGDLCHRSKERKAAQKGVVNTVTCKENKNKSWKKYIFPGCVTGGPFTRVVCLSSGQVTGKLKEC